VIKNNSLHDTATRQRFRELFSAEGIAGDRIELLASVASLHDHLAHYAKLDIALDTFPYNGTTTTCEALWMSVPVITRKTATSAGRVGASLLSQVELTELISENDDDYFERAVTLAADTDRLSGLRRNLRSMVQASPLCDSRAFAAKIETALQRAWFNYCA
jgi:predicted O-linked N-acetylglucosamine transferase (SPINDLY family)